MSLEGSQLGQYRLVRLLGSGGMGEVYLAEDARINQQVAIKVSKSEASSYPNSDIAKDAIRLFQREAKAIARLDHPRILPLYSYGEQNMNGVILTYIVMPFRPEGSFANWLQRRNSSSLLPPQDIAYFTSQAADALQYAHDNQVIHQDVKPSNFLVRTNKEHPNHPDLQLADFGIARLNSGTTSVSQTVRGTSAYMAPEQWSGDPVPATDQYALAVLAYELLVGRPPFIGRQEQVMYQHISVQPQPPSTLNPALSKGIDTIILQALAKLPEGRFISISAFAQAFQQATQNNDLSTFIKIPDAPNSSDLHTTLAISRAEARAGTSRTLTLPGGRIVTVTIPADAYDGKVLRIEGLGERPYSGGITGALIITLSVKYPDERFHPSMSSTDKTVPASNPGIRGDFAIPSSSSSMGSVPGSSYTSNIPNPSRRQESPRGKFIAIALIGLALLVVAFSAGFFYLQSINRTGLNNPDAVATTHANDATSFAATATTRAKNSATKVPSTTVIPNTNSFPPAGATLVLDDLLSSNSSANNWLVYHDANGACEFTGGAYHISYSKLNYYLFCTARTSDFSNFAYQVQMTFIQGDTAGMVFRVNNTSSNFYYFHISRNGSYGLDLYTDNIRSHATPLKSGFSSAIYPTLNQTNLMALLAIGNNFDLYVNNAHIASATDNNIAYSHGQIGLIADAINGPTEVVFSNAKVWTL